MAAYTIGYQPQFVQSDIGSIQKRLAEMQSQYDTAYQGQLEAEDAFGNIPVVSQSDMGLRDEVLGGFKNKVQTIVDEYGGDYGAASKRLAKEIIATKSNPFFQLAARKAQLAEEQRKLASQPGSIVLQDVRNVNLRDAQGNYISPDQLGYNVTTRDYLRKELGNAYGALADKISMGDYKTLRNTPWLIQKAVTKGITEQEVPAVAENMMGTLKQMYPTLPEDVVQSIAVEQANQLVKGTTFQESSNRAWEVQQEAAEWNRREDFKEKQAADKLAKKEVVDKSNFLKQDRSRQYLTEDPRYKDKENTLSRFNATFTDSYTGKTYNNPFEAKKELDEMKKQQSFYTKERERLKKAYNINAIGLPEKRIQVKDGLITGADAKYNTDVSGWNKQRDARLAAYQKDLAKLERDETAFRNKVEAKEKAFKGYIPSDKEFNNALKLYGLPENTSYDDFMKHVSSDKTLVDNKVIDLNATNSAGATLKNDMVGSALRYVISTTAPEKITIKVVKDRLNNAKSKDISKEDLAKMLNPENVDAISLSPGFIENNELLVQGIDGSIIAVPARLFGSQVEGIMNTPIYDPSTGKQIATYKDYYKQLRKNNDSEEMTKFENIISEKIANSFNYNFYQMQGSTAKQE